MWTSPEKNTRLNDTRYIYDVNTPLDVRGMENGVDDGKNIRDHRICMCEPHECRIDTKHFGIERAQQLDTAENWCTSCDVGDYPWERSPSQPQSSVVRWAVCVSCCIAMPHPIHSQASSTQTVISHLTHAPLTIRQGGEIFRRIRIDRNCVHVWQVPSDTMNEPNAMTEPR